ncbi:hypothetical protein [Streptomyces sp. NPDC002467]|uniref:hypothetical protein n=1 Tax=Streptomyces sp. NPDC002467 TaxID=3364647 RepID=UPI0036BAA49C
MAATPTEGRCQSCQQTRPLFEFQWIPAGFHEFYSAQLCTRCHSAASLEDEQDGLAFDVFEVFEVAA